MVDVIEVTLPKRDACDICGREGTSAWLRCRFERGCSCWRGVPCGGLEPCPDCGITTLHDIDSTCPVVGSAEREGTSRD